MNDSKKLKGKDLINIGIFTAIYFVVILVFAMLGFIPVFMPLMAVFDPLFGGIVFMRQYSKSLIPLLRASRMIWRHSSAVRFLALVFIVVLLFLLR